MRVRFRFAKSGKVRFTSHRDVARLWERALRRAELPVASTEGFSPRPKVHFGLALSTGHESLGEYIDVDFREPEALALDVGGLAELLTPLFPSGIDVEAAEVVERSTTSLQEAVVSCTWRIPVRGADGTALSEGVDRLLALDHIPVTRERKGKQVDDDLRPAILELRVELPDVLIAELATQPRGVRPSELLESLSMVIASDSPLEEGRVCRTHQWIELDGARREPIPLDATWATHAQARAS